MQGLKKNAAQFYLLVLVNAFVGAMIGLERSVLPELGKEVFFLSEYTVILSFILAFGITKSFANLAVAKLMLKMSRKKVLIIGWIAAIPVPFLLIYASSWWWVIAANIFLGINQGLAWSSTVIMKIDLVGNKNRGLAMGINEFAGYISVGLAALLASSLASNYGYRFFPFLPGVFFVIAGLFITIFLIKDTSHFVHQEAQTSTNKIFNGLFTQISWKHHNMGTVSINGLVNNMNDAMVWGVLPLLLIQRGFSAAETGWVAAVYPATWGFIQLFTGKLGDHSCKKQLITLGMMLQGLAIILMTFLYSFGGMLAASALLGIGTALVYPNFLTVMAENLHPAQRASGLSLFRFWRDSGYVIGAILVGFLADGIGLIGTLIFIALLTIAAGLFAQLRMCCTLKILWRSKSCADMAIY
ncbi:MAG: MFS transporter [Sediminibacterium sp.]